MALSNVKSAEYRAAGGRQWNRVKSGNRHTRWDGPVPEYVTAQRHKVMDENDANVREKERVRADLAEGYDESLVTVVPEGKSGIPRKGKAAKKRKPRRRK